MSDPILWQPSSTQLASSQMTQFMDQMNQQHVLNIQDYAELHAHSIRQRADFWRAVLEFCGVIYHQDAQVDLIDEGHMIDAQWFRGMTLNFAENLLRHRGSNPAVVFESESGQVQTWSHDDLRTEVARVQQQLLASGVGVGDRVAGFLPNIPETLVAMLATQFHTNRPQVEKWPRRWPAGTLPWKISCFKCCNEMPPVR